MTKEHTSADNRDQLAFRARARREQLGLSRSDLARQIGVNAATIANWERRIPKGPDKDVTWETALQVPRGWLRTVSVIDDDLMQASSLSDDERVELGQRARQQRESMGLTRLDIASKSLVAPHTIHSWEKRLPKSTAFDAAWEMALNVPSGWLRSKHGKVIEVASTFSPSNEASATLAESMAELFTWFVEDNQAKRSLDHSRLSPNQKRDVEIMLQRYGVLGEEASTLQAIGDAYGITKERVRKITERVTGKLQREQVHLPVLDRVKAAANAIVPARVSTLTLGLRSVLGQSLSIEGADRFAREFLGEAIVKTEPATGMYASVGEKIAFALTGDDAAIRTVRQVSLAMIRSTGAAQAYFVAGAASQELGIGITPAQVAQYCAIWHSFEWLEERDGWFWFGPSYDNRAVSCAMKVLSIANRNVDIEEIQAAMTRSRVRYEADKARPFLINAPTVVLQKVLSSAPQIELMQYNDFRLRNIQIDREEYEDAYLSESEIACLEVIRNNGGVVTRKVLYSELVEERGMVPMTFHMVLDSSPIMHRLDIGLWTLAGTKIDPVALLQAASKMASAAEEKFEISE
jgi:transcriptional regulator with XRE-family HTH domain/uncharacterized membrane protein